MSRLFSWSRWLGIVGKEFTQLKRDRLTFAMIVGIPVLQLILFGFAINSDPKHMPAAVRDADRSEFSRSILAALANSDYFKFVRDANDDAAIDRMLATGAAQFVITIPEGFSRALVRGERPALLVEADATDPSATGNAIAAVNALAQGALARELTGPLAPLAASPGAFEIRVHSRYNPEAITQYNVVPGLMGVIRSTTCSASLWKFPARSNQLRSLNPVVSITSVSPSQCPFDQPIQLSTGASVWLLMWTMRLELAYSYTNRMSRCPWTIWKGYGM